jgi:hypothetical protein
LVGGLAPGNYVVEFLTAGFMQFANGQTDPFNATVFSVKAGADTVLDELT